MTRRLHYVAEPVDEHDSTSPWLTTRPKAIKVVRKMLGKSDYEAHAGAYSGGANAVHWVEVIGEQADGTFLVKNITEGAKHTVDETQAILEAEFLYPLLRGTDVRRWRAKASAHILLVQDPKLRKGVNEAVLQKDFPRTRAYLKQFERALRERAAFKRYYTRQRKGKVVETAPFYSMFDVADYTLSRYKVVWGRIGSSIGADLVGDEDGKPIVPQETHTLVAVESKSEALYLAAVLNSLPFNFAAVSYSQTGGKSFGSPHILENIRVPRYDPKKLYCTGLTQAAQKARKAVATNDTAGLVTASAQINELVLDIWQLTHADLKEIEACFSEITKADLRNGEGEGLLKENAAEGA